MNTFFKYLTPLLLLATVFILSSVSSILPKNHSTTNQRIHVKTKTHTIETFICKTPKRLKINEELTYYWYKTRKISSTKGGFSGNLLDGKFDKFDFSKNLIQQGFFKKGLKHGSWKEWYTSGELKATINYKKGRKHGMEILYDERGLVVSEKKYFDGRLKF